MYRFHANHTDRRCAAILSHVSCKTWVDVTGVAEPECADALLLSKQYKHPQRVPALKDWLRVIEHRNNVHHRVDLTDAEPTPTWTVRGWKSMPAVQDETDETEGEVHA
ncbi:hypothetical protein [Mycolicibacterium stellerae]|uniref:hypothetical protein n=1 Tax=Mycolicibacterium stellerae TaxID=2358193 RepID=UPI000F0B27E0|nr:hypothetical protein [Mycolicibacterium stellerae]